MPYCSALNPARKIRTILAAVMLNAIWFIADSQGQVPAIRQINLRQGLPQSEVTCMIEDSRGLIWAGTRGGGLVYLDGNNLQVFNSGNGLASDFISDVGEFPDGRLSVSTLYGGLQHFDGQKFSKATRFPESAELLKSIISDNNLVFGIHSQGVTAHYLKEKKNHHLYTFRDEISRIHCGTLVGNRWLLISVDSGLYSVDTKSLNRSLLLGQKSHLTGRRIAAVHALNGQSAVLVSSDGFTSVLDFDQGWPLISAWNPIPNLHLNAGESVRFVVFGLGQFLKCICTSKNRLISQKSGILELSQLNGMKVSPVSGLISDRNGTVWLGTSGSGILMKPLQSALSFSANPLLANGRLNAVLKTKEGILICGGLNTGLIISKEGNQESACLFPETDVRSIAESRKYIFAGTDKGFRIIRKKDWVQEKYFTETGKTIRFCVLPDETLLIGTFGNGAWYMKPGQKPERLIPAESGIAFPYEFIPGEKGEVLIPTNNGLWKHWLVSGVTEKVKIPANIAPMFFMGTRDKHGNYWFSTNDGIVRMSGSQWTKLGTKNGLSSSLTYTLNADSVGNIWVGGSHGLDKVALDLQGRVKEIINYGPEEGFDGYESNMRASFATRDFLYVCTVQGLFAMPVREPAMDPLPVKPEIKAFLTLSRNRYDSLPARNLSWFYSGGTDYHLQQPELLIFDFKTINPVFPSKIKYSYRISGNGNVWSKPSTESRVSFPGPEAGNYAFEVRSTYDGVYFSEPSRLEFSISVPWYMRKFVIVPALLLVFVLAGLYVFSLERRPETYDFFRRNLKWPASRARLFLLVFAIFYPLLPFLAARFDSGICLHPLETLLIFLSLTGLFLFSVLIRQSAVSTEILLKTAFLIMVGDSLYGIVHNHMSPFLITLFFAVSGLIFVLFSRPLPFLLFGAGINIFAFLCAQYIPEPLFNPVSFQLAAAGLSVVMVLVMLATHSSEENLRFADKVVNEGPVLVLAFDHQNNLVYTSGNIESMTGYKAETISGRNWQDRIIGNEADRLEFNNLLSTEESKDIRISLQNTLGENRVFRFQAKSLDQRFRIMLGEDISEKEFLESRFEYLVENATDSIFLTDVRGKILYSNPESTFMLGLEKADLIGRNYTEFVEETYRDSIRTFYEKQLAEKVSGSYQEFPVLTKGEQVRWMAFQTSVLYQRDGQTVEGLLAIGRDITERIETEQLILVQHKNITDSMTYASRIRSALQPEKQALSELFTRYAILDEPRDIIGGDFFWLGENGTSAVFVIGDCTGHGVPGAFMTTISMGILRENIRGAETQNLEDLLGNFNRSLKHYLGRTGNEETVDFAEIALISLDYEKRELLFISSGIGLYRLRNGELTAFREASRGFAFRLDYSGQTQRIPLEAGDVFYAFTDGMYDQIGGEKGKRLSKSRLLSLIRESDSLNLENGLSQIKKGILSWQGGYHQTDDRMMIAFRF